jgi:hypothetical protein
LRDNTGQFPRLADHREPTQWFSSNDVGGINDGVSGTRRIHFSGHYLCARIHDLPGITGGAKFVGQRMLIL